MLKPVYKANTILTLLLHRRRVLLQRKFLHYLLILCWISFRKTWTKLCMKRFLARIADAPSNLSSSELFKYVMYPWYEKHSTGLEFQESCLGDLDAICTCGILLNHGTPWTCIPEACFVVLTRLKYMSSVIICRWF